MTNLPVTILIQGGIASGKSTVAKLIAAQGGTFVDCDRLGHEVLDEAEVLAALRDAFGPDVFDADAAARAWGDTLAFLRAELP